jgi:hypothetical protein
MLQKNIQFGQIMKIYGLFWAMGFMFSDRFVKIVSNFEIKLFCHCLVTFGFQRSFVDR